MINSTYKTMHIDTILCSQQNIGVFTSLICRTFALPTIQQSLELQCSNMKLDALRRKKQLVDLLETIKAKQREFDELVVTFKRTDRQLAEIDGRLKIYKKRKATVKRQTSGKLQSLVATPGRKELNKALKLMSQKDRDELLKEMLK